MDKKDLVFEDFELNSTIYKTTIPAHVKDRKKWVKKHLGDIESVIPGTILGINVKVGDKVKEGDVLCKLEAMKMENKVEAPIEGVIRALHIRIGDKIPKGHLMFEID